MLAGGRAFEILRMEFDASDDEDVFEAPCDVQNAVTHEAEVPRAQERTLAVRCVRAKRARALFRPIPVPARHARAGDPDLACLTGGTRMPAGRIDDEEPRAERWSAASDRIARLGWGGRRTPAIARDEKRRLRQTERGAEGGWPESAAGKCPRKRFERLAPDRFGAVVGVTPGP